MLYKFKREKEKIKFVVGDDKYYVRKHIAKKWARLKMIQHSFKCKNR